jgi:hypothetical protein
MSPRQGDGSPLIGEHPYLAAARERANPTATGDSQVVGDLDRLQLAERELAAALAVAHDAQAAALAPVHQGRADELRRLIVELGGAPSDHGLRELPHEPEQLGGVLDRRAIHSALADDGRVLAELYEVSAEHAFGLPAVHERLTQHLIATRVELARFDAVAFQSSG